MSFLKESFSKYQQGNPCLPMYMVFDHDFRKSRNVWPWQLPNFMLAESHFESGLIAKGNTLTELANELGIDAIGLENTVQRFNGFAQTGKDLDFKRGDAEFTPNPCLAAVKQAPFYAVRLDAGDFGTQGGLVINEDAQACTEQGDIIEGLYAFGNT